MISGGKIAPSCYYLTLIALYSLCFIHYNVVSVINIINVVNIVIAVNVVNIIINDITDNSVNCGNVISIVHIFNIVNFINDVNVVNITNYVINVIYDVAKKITAFITYTFTTFKLVDDQLLTARQTLFMYIVAIAAKTLAQTDKIE